MNNRFKIAAFAIAMFGFSVVSYAQSSATATATATADIVSPISISKNADISFGRVTGSATTQTTVVLATDGTTTSSDGAVIVANGTPTAAAFTVTGDANYTYAVTLPETHTITDGTNNLTVGTFVSNANGNLTEGSGTFNVGATLTIPAGATSGTYTSGTPFNVTVDYQ